MKTFIFKKAIPLILSILAIYFVWDYYADMMNAPLILPSPQKVFTEILSLLQSRSFWDNFFYTFMRVGAAFLISCVLGIILGLISASSEFLKSFLSFPLSVIRSTPVIAIILMALYWFDSNLIAVFAACLMTLPVITTSIIQGFGNSDKKLLQMAKIYKFSRFQNFKYIKLPAVLPFFLSSLISAFGLSWKVVVAGEVLSIPKLGIGTILQGNQVIFETSKVLGITIILVVVCFIIESFLKLIFRKSLREITNER